MTDHCCWCWTWQTKGNEFVCQIDFDLIWRKSDDQCLRNKCRTTIDKWQQTKRNCFSNQFVSIISYLIDHTIIAYHHWNVYSFIWLDRGNSKHLIKHVPCIACLCFSSAAIHIIWNFSLSTKRKNLIRITDRIMCNFHLWSSSSSSSFVQQYKVSSHFYFLIPKTLPT